MGAERCCLAAAACTAVHGAHCKGDKPNGVAAAAARWATAIRQHQLAEQHGNRRRPLEWPLREFSRLSSGKVVGAPGAAGACRRKRKQDFFLDRISSFCEILSVSQTVSQTVSPSQRPANSRQSLSQLIPLSSHTRLRCGPSSIRQLVCRCVRPSMYLSIYLSSIYLSIANHRTSR